MSHNGSPSLYRSPQDAIQAPREEFLYLVCLHEGTGIDAPDFLAVVDDGQIVHELPMPNTGDELHHSAGTAARRPATAPTAHT
jgi:methanethiol oxidase